MKNAKCCNLTIWLFEVRAVVIVVSLLLAGSWSPCFGQGSEALANSDLSGRCLAENSEYTFSGRTGMLDSVMAPDGIAFEKTASPAGFDSAAQVARGYLENCGSLFGMDDAGANLQLRRQQQIEGGHSVVKFQQTYMGVPIFAGEINIELNARQDVVLVNGSILPESPLDTTPTLSAAEAKQTALNAVNTQYQLNTTNTLAVSKPALWIYDPTMIGYSGPTVLVWKMEISQNGPPPIRQLMLVDAQSGNIALSLNQLHTARNRMTYDMNNGTTYPGSLRCDEANPNCTGGDAQEASAHIYSGDTYNFYNTIHGRDSIDNAGMTLNSHVHYDTDYCNAFWNGARMTYGDGCNIVVDDVVAHEMTHGVTDYESDLVYANQSGAINEAFSDIWGEFVDLTNYKGTDTAAMRWLIAEDSSVGAIRNMMFPPAFKDPDSMSSVHYYWGDDDNGGVHGNSGVANKAAYLITDGSTFGGYKVSGIGIAKVAKIFYKVQRDILTSGATYTDLGKALWQACILLRGTNGITTDNCSQVLKATYATKMASPRGDSFSSSFTNDADGWEAHRGIWNVNAGAYESKGYATASTWASASYKAEFKNFDVTTRVSRLDGEDDTNASYLTVRGVPTFVRTEGHHPAIAYFFGYSPNGYYSIWKITNGDVTNIQPWTYSDAIRQGSLLNVLRVRAWNDTFKFYINGTLLYTGAITNLNIGRVGFTFHNGVGSGNRFRVDYVNLTKLVSTTATIADSSMEEVNPEQEELNQASKADPGTVLTIKYYKP